MHRAARTSAKENWREMGVSESPFPICRGEWLELTPLSSQPRGPHPLGRGAEHMWTPMDLQARAPIWGCPRELCVSALHARQTRVSGAHRPACLAGGVNDLDARAKSALRRASLRRRLTLLAASDVSAPSALCLASRRGGSSRSASCAAGCSARTSVEPRARLGLCRCRPVPCSLAPPCPCAASAGVASALEPSSRPWLRFLRRRLFEADVRESRPPLRFLRRRLFEADVREWRARGWVGGRCANIRVARMSTDSLCRVGVIWCQGVPEKRLRTCPLPSLFSLSLARAL